MGAGEILLTSIDMEGTKKGFDLELIKKVSEVISIPLIASGGAGNVDHISDCIIKGKVNAVAMAAVLHYNLLTIKEIKEHLSNQGILVRKI